MLAAILIAALGIGSVVLTVPEALKEPAATALTANGCPADQPWTDNVLAGVLGVPVETVGMLHIIRGLTPSEICTMPRDKLNRAIGKVDQPKPDYPGEAARFRAQQLASDDGTVRPDGLPNAIAQRASLASRFDASANGVLPNAWTALGPGSTGGRIRTVLTHPTDPNLLFVGSVSGGVWKSLDAGITWAPVNDFMPNVAITTMVRDPSNPQRIYAGTGEGFISGGVRGFGAFVSTDGGTVWSQLGGTVPDIGNPPTRQSDFFYVNRIAVHPTNPDIVLIATSGNRCDWGGVYRSTNATSPSPVWTLVYSRKALDVKFDPGNGNRVVVGEGKHCLPATPNSYVEGGGVAYSSNAGASFTRIPLETVSPGRVEVAWAPATPGLVVAVTDAYPAPATDGRFWVSTNYGQTWVLNSQPAHLGLQGWYNNSVWVDPTDSRRIVVGGIDLYRGAGVAAWWTNNAAVPWTKISQWFTAGSVHADNHAIVQAIGYNGTSNRSVYIGNDGGLYKSNDIAAHDGVNFTGNWVNLNNGLQITQFYSGAGKSGYAGGATLIVGGTQDNGSLKAPVAGLAWTSFFGGDGGYSAVDPVDPNFYYGEYVYATIHRATTGGNSANICGGPNPIIEALAGQFGCAANATKEANFIAPFILDPNNPNTMLVGAKSLWRSTDVKAATPNWFMIKPADPRQSNYISAVAAARGNSNILWVGHNFGEVYCTLNGTASSPTWTKIGALAGRMVMRIMIDPSNSNRVFVTYGGYDSGNVLELTDPNQACSAGVTVTNRQGNLPQAPVRSIERHPTDATRLYVGTEIGVFATTDSGVTWSASNEGPGTVSVDELFWLDSTTLVAATHGRGMFRTSLTPTAGLPSVATVAPSIITSTGATLAGTASSNGAATTVTFQYGLTTGYGSTTTATQSPLDAGASGIAVSATIGGLSCNTLYHYRVVGSNSAGTANGSDMAFTTTGCSGVTSSTTTLSSNANPSAVGTVVSFVASVSGAAPTGGVDFRDGNTVIGGCAAVVLAGIGNTRQATCLTNGLSVGTHSIVATYNGDAGNTPSVSSTLSQQVVMPLPITATIISNPYGTMTVQGGTLSGNNISITSSNAVIQLGAGTSSNSYAQIDFQGLHVGPGNTLTIRSGASGQILVLRNANSTASAIGGTLQGQGGNGAPPPELYVWNQSGIAIATSGNVSSQSGLSLDALTASWTSGQNLTSAGNVDGGPYLELYGAIIRGGGAFKGNQIGLHTFGTANNPVNSADFLQNGLQLYPSTGNAVSLTLNGYGSGKQVFNLFAHGNASFWMPSAWPAGYNLPVNNAVVMPNGTRPAGVPEPAYGGGSMILQSSGSLTLVNGGTNDFVFPGAIVLRAQGDLNINGVAVDQGWTMSGQAFQGIFFESPNIVSPNGLIRVYGNNLNWVNFSTLPNQYVRAFTLKPNPDGSTSFAVADTTTPHLNTYSTILNVAASGGCWTCMVNSQVIDVYGP